MITALPSNEKTSPGADWGGFVNDGVINLPWKLLAEEYGIVWFCTQGSMQSPGFDSLANIAEARHWVDVVGTYYMEDADFTLQGQIDFFSRAIDLEKPDFYWLDVERDKGVKGPFEPAKIAAHVQGLFEGLRSRFPQIRSTIYTRVDFIRSFAPGLTPLMASLDHVSMAAWPDFGLEAYYQPLADIKAGIMAECLNFAAPAPRPRRTINIFDGQHGPDLSLSPKADIFFWQHSSRIHPLEIKGDQLFDHGYDWDRINLPKDKLLRWIKFQPLEEEEEPQHVEPLSDLTLASLDARLKIVEEKLRKLESQA